MEKITAEQKKNAKGRGFLPNRDGEFFSARVLTENGVFTDSQLTALAQAAAKFGNGEVALTVRLTAEIQKIKYEDIEKVIDFLRPYGLEIGGTGAKVRPIVCCKGTVCVFGNIDTQTLGTTAHKRFYEGYIDVKLPHKFKIAIGGCPNNCVKPELNDVGIVGVRVPKFDFSKCRNCKKCAVSELCPQSAFTRGDAALIFSREACSDCGRCVGKCPFQIDEPQEPQVKIFIGGRWGKKTRIGNRLSGTFSLADALDVTEQALLFYRANAYQGERFAELIDRIGIEQAEAGIRKINLSCDREGIIASEIKSKA